MEINSIKEIKEHINQIEEIIKDINFEEFEDETFGSEGEYTYKGLISGLNALLTDLKALVKYPLNFLKYSSYEERNNIYSTLASIVVYHNRPSTLVSFIDKLKSQIKPFNIRFQKVRLIEFDSEIEELTKRKVDFIDVLNTSKGLNEETKSLISGIGNKKEELEAETTKIAKIFQDLDNKKEVVENSLEELNLNIEKIETSLSLIEEKKASVIESETEVKSNEKLIDSFVQKVQQREKVLEDIDAKTKEYLEYIDAFKKEKEELLIEAKKLISSAKTALNYKTAEGLSASFLTQYEAEKASKPHYWIFGALGCIVLALGIGIWIVVDKYAELNSIIGRITMLPLPISGAIFCANMYVRRTNLIQDYAYKMVLSKSIVGFSEQLKNGSPESSDGYTSYIKKVLDEIHQDPMRRRVITNSKTEKSEDELNNPLIDTVNKALSVIEKTLANGK